MEKKGTQPDLFLAQSVFLIGIRFGFVKDEMYKMPKELRERVLITIKDYVEEKERELREI